jgi:hypothetical protein
MNQHFSLFTFSFSLPQFSDFWDDLYGEFEMGDYSFPASEVLFSVDYKAYVSELQAFSEGYE